MQHQPVLVRVVHVMQLYIRVGGQDAVGRHLPCLQRVERLVGMNTGLPDQAQKGLRQPRNAQRCAEVHEGAARGADHHRGVPPPWVKAAHPIGNLGRIDSSGVLGREAFERAGQREGALAQTPRQVIREADDRLQRAWLPQCGEVLAVEKARDGAQHHRGRIEVGDAERASAPAHAEPPRATPYAGFRPRSSPTDRPGSPRVPLASIQREAIVAHRNRCQGKDREQQLQREPAR